MSGCRTIPGCRLARARLPHEVHAAVFDWVLALIGEAGLVKGERIGVDASTMEANAALRNIVRRDTGEGYREMLEHLARESGIETPTAEDLARLDRSARARSFPTRTGFRRAIPIHTSQIYPLRSSGGSASDRRRYSACRIKPFSLRIRRHPGNLELDHHGRNRQRPVETVAEPKQKGLLALARRRGGAARGRTNNRTRLLSGVQALVP